MRVTTIWSLLAAASRKIDSVRAADRRRFLRGQMESEINITKTSPLRGAKDAAQTSLLGVVESE